MRTEQIKKIILKMFRGRELYGYEIKNRLDSEKVKIEISRLYRVLKDMLGEGLLKYRWEQSQSGPKRRMYRLSEKGNAELQEVLVDAISTVHDFYNQYLQSFYPKFSVLDEIMDPFTDGSEGSKNIAYITTRFLGAHKLMISKLKEKVPEGKTYVIKPRAVELMINFENLQILNGDFCDIPLKAGYVDILMVVGLPNKELLGDSVKEWYRVINSKGKLGILAPTILFTEYQEPLTIGDFVEKYEHETIEGGAHIASEVLQTLLEKYFKKVEVKSVLHMSLMMSSEPRK